MFFLFPLDGLGWEKGTVRSLIHNSNDSEDDFAQVCRNVSNVNNNSSFQNYTNPDDHTQQTKTSFAVPGISLEFQYRARKEWERM